MALAKSWGTIAPFYIDQEAPAVPGGLPRVGPLKVNLPNNHLQYAITWYGLAVVLVIVSLLLFRSRRREGRGRMATPCSVSRNSSSLWVISSSMGEV